MALLRMEANIMKSRSDLSRKTQWTKHPPPPPPPAHHLVAKAFSSRRLSSSSSSISLSRYLNPSDIHDDDGYSQQLYNHGGITVSIPFNWESQPGTPKVRFRDDAVPPLTPPPSYFCTPARDTNNSKLRRKAKFLTSILPKLRSSSPPSPTSSSSSSSSSFKSSVPPSPAVGGRAGTSTSRLSLPTRAGKWEEEEFEDHVPALSFGFGRRGTNARPRGCYLAMIRVLHGNFP